MIQPLNRARNVMVAADQIREAHGLGERCIRWPELRVILANEGIRVRRYAMKPRAYIAGWSGHYVIALRNTIALAAASKLLLHEYAHAKLHLFDEDEPTRQLVACAKDDPREDEANLLAALLWHGPDAMSHRGVRMLMAKLEGGEYRKRMPQQYPLELPERVPVYGAETFAWHEEQLAAAQPNPRLARLPDAKRVRLAGASDPFTAKFVDRVGRVWHIYDRPGRRLFYNSMTLRKVYQFRRGELTALRCKHLDRQLKEATDATVRHHDSAHSTPARRGGGIGGVRG